MNTENRTALRSVWILLVAVAGFIGALATLPVPGDAAAPEQEAPEESFAIVDVTLFDGEAFRPNQDVWVEDGRVRRVGAKLRLPDDLPRVDGRGHTLLPGLIDGHVHTFGGTLGDALRFGVTAVLDQFTDPGLAAAARTARDEIARTAEADLFSAGMLATAPGGHGTQFGLAVEPLTGPEGADAWVRARKAEGSDWIKIVSEDGAAYRGDIPSLERETIAALIGAAHAEGLLAVVHVSDLEAALEAVSLGADGLVHTWFDAAISEEGARSFAEAGVFVVPTLSVIMGLFGDSTGLRILHETEEALVSPMQRQTLSNRFEMPEGPDSEVALENVRRLHAAGVRIVAGTDAPNPGTATGLSMHGELRLLARAGLESHEVLAAATSVAADAFAVPERGRIAEGTIADLLLVRGDVEEDLARTADIVTIWKDGYPVVRETASTASSPEIPPAPEGPVIVDFEDGLDSGFGFGWQVTTDAMNGGASTADLAVEDGALVVRGEIRAGFAFPWAGAIWFTGAQPMQAVDFSGRSVLRFRTRGDGRSYTVMLFGAGAAAAVPPTVPFVAGPEWAVVEIPLESFATADPSVIAALAFVAQAPLGSFTFELDDVEIR
ncbi:MAG: CIA30 family protein [Gemmatimonadota bacterium]|uniref:CIA30 family protein n=1 Tax=Candidatus Palauibacter scopulicola TaxID=3056741 RepID=UPI00239A78BD|nr:CIA30 family protein [Candidatus Palauibacter scopulicola]MDE2664170.1 CIA30 family protein [Candidatus Palauibacter scopulicola]